MAVLSTKTQCNLNNAEKYFKEHLQLGDYYSQENIVSGEWAGIGAETLGLTGRVKEDQFLKLCHNQDPSTGELLTQRMKTTRWDSDKMAEVANRRVFYDFTFSPPKSVSIQALIADDKRLLESHSRAVRIAVNELQHFAGTQVHRGMDKSERLVMLKGKGLEPLCDAMERLAVERIKTCPEKYGAIARNEGVIEDIEIKQRGKEN